MNIAKIFRTPVLKNICKRLFQPLYDDLFPLILICLYRKCQTPHNQNITLIAQWYKNYLSICLLRLRDSIMDGKYYVTQVTMAEFRQSGIDYSIPLEDL